MKQRHFLTHRQRAERQKRGWWSRMNPSVGPKDFRKNGLDLCTSSDGFLAYPLLYPVLCHSEKWWPFFVKPKECIARRMAIEQERGSHRDVNKQSTSTGLIGPLNQSVWREMMAKLEETAANPLTQFFDTEGVELRFESPQRACLLNRYCHQFNIKVKSGWLSAEKHPATLRTVGHLHQRKKQSFL
ncbi:hypothetical protein JOQ06_014825 [Pogonophryne albipinna]|uniref:Uncharacterized protein n=1 Tax=Pogonophryne albipinna TaxID=1090488 RepID=A0AAD6FB58_9TELE|nr:hypothetical protein JOQ06_014825 [Pogonophryne albipinna]